MGNNVGHVFENAYNLYMHPDVTPSPLDEPSYDPNFGFPNGRVERVPKATKEEMVSAKIPLDKRDYCAHLAIAYKACRKDNWPWAVNCSHEKHAYLNCEYEDFILRMKEYERERRLRVKCGPPAPPVIETPA